MSTRGPLIVVGILSLAVVGETLAQQLSKKDAEHIEIQNLKLRPFGRVAEIPAASKEEARHELLEDLIQRYPFLSWDSAEFAAAREAADMDPRSLIIPDSEIDARIMHLKPPDRIDPGIFLPRERMGAIQKR